MATPVVQCILCKHYKGDLKCEAFNDKIPVEILTNIHDHKKEFEGDGGVRFEPK